MSSWTAVGPNPQSGWSGLPIGISKARTYKKLTVVPSNSPANLRGYQGRRDVRCDRACKSHGRGHIDQRSETWKQVGDRRYNYFLFIPSFLRPPHTIRPQRCGHLPRPKMSLINSLLFSLALSGSLARAAPKNAGLLADIVDGVQDAATGLPSLSSALQAATATTAAPSDISEASARLSSAIQAEPTGSSYENVAIDLIEAALTTENVKDFASFAAGLVDGENSSNNINPRIPVPPAYPRAGLTDAPYSQSEQTLRGAIYIPPTFKYGRPGAPQPVILVPGTGNTGYITFKGNYIPLLQGSDIGDPVWLNIPGYLLGDAQVNSEFVAYAINYIYGISNQRKPAVFSWSQGGLDAQWAFKYWPSTRSRVTDLVAFSPDFHGTVFADLLAAPGEPLPPSVLQQEYNSNFITTLRSNGGDSAYVPTTTVYSAFFDEIVEPQQGTGASAFIKDARNRGVTNNEVQTTCPIGTAGGSFYSHEGTLYNPLGYALAVDALKHDGPGDPKRLDLAKVCAPYLTPGLDLADFLITENVILVAGVTIVTYPQKVTQEPPIKRESRK